MKIACVILFTLYTVYAVPSRSYYPSYSGLEQCQRSHACKRIRDTKFRRFYGDANIFVSCNGGRVDCQQCSESNLVFNEYCQQCLPKAEDKRNKCDTDNQKPAGIDFCAPYGFCKKGYRGGQFFAAEYGRKFFSCIAGEATACQTCPKNAKNEQLLFSESCQQCLPKYAQYKCFTNTGVDGGEVDCGSFCMHLPDGDYAINEYKKSVYFNTCTEGRCVRRRCAGKRVKFNKNCGRCGGCSYKKRHH